ncbi:MAG: hypothetical protein HOP33_23375 [Verrucomicrobia bacterium]|nr:hypothetical protein [Verrucomicrobiota bacterium]
MPSPSFNKLILWAFLAAAFLGLAIPSTVCRGASDLNGDFAIETWTTDNGMPHNTVTALIQTRNGYIWVATYHGIAQFDGDRFKVFDTANTKGLDDSRITALYEDAQGVVWIGHDRGEVTRYVEGRFESVALDKSWGNANVVAFGNDEHGDLWVLNLRGEAVRLRDFFLIKPLPQMAAEPTMKPSLAADADHRLYVLRNGLAARITQNGYQPETFDGDYHAQLTRAFGGGFWVAGVNRLRRWDGEKWIKDFGPFRWDDSFITTMLETSNHRVLVGTLLGGLYVVDESGGWFCLSRTNGLSHDWVRCLIEDREHNIWVGTSGGLVLLRERKVAMLAPPDDWEGRPVMGITRTHDGAIWAATEGAGVYRKKGDEWTHFGLNTGLSNLFVWSVMEDNSHHLWAGTWGGGLFRFDGEKFVRQFELAELSEPVTALHESPPGTIWIGTEAGLIRYASNKLERFAGFGDAAAGAVRAIESGAPGEIWFGTQGSGLGRIHDGKFTSYGRAEGLDHNSILSLHYDGEGVLWIGTLEHGVCRFKDGRFITITAEHGLPNNIIDHIEEDGLGNFWFNSQNGLFRVGRQELNNCADGKTNFLRALVFGKAEGMTTLAGSGGFTPSGFQSPDGRLWFPTARGLAVLNPTSVRPNRIPPPVLIEEVLVDGQQVVITNRPVGRSKQENSPTRGIVVPPGRRSLVIKFTGMSFTSPSRVQFKYRLEGSDLGWTEGVTQRQVTYSSLPPGEFVFRVIASNSDGLWNEIGDAMAIEILPRFFQTWWFNTVLALAAVITVGGGVFLESRRRMRRKLERIAREHELERERSRIAQDIHDDLGASLTRIGMLSEAAVGEMNISHKTAENLSQIQATTGELTRSMDEIVWAVNPRHDTLESLTNYISRFAQDFLGTAQIRCRLALPLELPELSVRSEVRHNLFLAFKETLHNAVKHSGASEVRVALQLVPGGFKLQIADNGRGFDPKRLNSNPDKNRPSPGNGLRSLRSRLAQINGRSEIHSAPGEGARVEFFIPLPDSARVTRENS